MRDYCAVAREYAAGVLDGSIPACRWVKLACARAQRDFDSQGQPDFSFYFSEAHANRVCAFMELLRHVQGPLGDQRLVLQPWQCFILCQIFGWLRNGTQVRRYRRVYICLPRGNGKSLLASGVSLYCAFAEGEPGADVIATATCKEQADIVLNTAQAMLLKDPKLVDKLGVEVFTNSVESKTDFSKLRSMPNKSSALQGTAVHMACVDELHANTKSGRATYSALSTATAKREQSLLWVITTSGMDTSGVCYELDAFVRQLLDGDTGASDNSFFGIIYTVDPEMEAEWDTEAAWRIASPNYGISVNPSVLADEANRARQLPSQQAEFKNKYLCIWVSSGGEQAFLDPTAIRKCYDAKLSEADFAQQPAVLGCDLASRLDLCSVCRVHARRDAQGNLHYYVFNKNWLPSATVEKSRNASYRGWQARGDLLVTEGVLTDLCEIEKYLLGVIHDYKIRELNYDPLQANMLVQRLKKATERHKHNMFIEAQQYAKFLTTGMQILEEIVAAGRLHTNSPVLLWCLGNLCVKRVGNGLMYPTRPANRELKIDAAVACVMALRGAAVNPLDESKRAPRIISIEY